MTSSNRPVCTSKMKPRTGTSFAIHGCARTFRICARVFSSGSLKANKRIGGRRGVTRFSGDLLVQLLVSEGCEPAAGVIEEHDLLATQDPRGNDEFSEHVVGDGR